MKKLFCILLALYLFCVPASALKGQVVDPNELPYIPSEGGPSSWAVSEIEQAAAAGLIPQLTGTPGYQDTITREQFAELAVQAVTVMLDAELDAAADTTFTDCQNPAVLQAYQAGIVSGVGERAFDPNTATNREQIAAMIARAISYVGGQTGVNIAPAAANVDGFVDKGEVSDWAVDSVGLLAANGIMSGTSDTTLSPKDPCTVEQSVLLLYRVYEQFGAAFAE